MRKKDEYHKTILCLIGCHKPSKYTFDCVNRKKYYICGECGKRLKIKVEERITT